MFSLVCSLLANIGKDVLYFLSAASYGHNLCFTLSRFSIRNRSGCEMSVSKDQFFLAVFFLRFENLQSVPLVFKGGEKTTKMVQN